MKSLSHNTRRTGRSSAPPAGSPERRLRVEPLEDRRMLSVVPQVLSTLLVDPADWIEGRIAILDNTVFFVLNSPTYGRELWKTDGTRTTDGTALVKDINPGGANSNPQHLTVLEDTKTLYFTATESTNGRELWKTDGTDDGTVLVKNINPGGDSSDPLHLLAVEQTRTLYFSAKESTNGRELWKTDGTTDGTVLLKNINPGTASSSPLYLTNVNQTIFFSADCPTYGRELWKTDGTTDGTVIAANIASGDGSSNPQGLTDLNGTLLFTADDGNGRRLYALAAVVADHTYTVDKGQTLTVDEDHGVLAGNTDVDPDSAAVVTTTANGTLTLNTDGSFTYTPPAGFNGTDTFTYKATEDGADTNVGTAYIAVLDPQGVVDFKELSNLDPGAGNNWYSFETARAGYLTAEATFQGDAESIRLALYADPLDLSALPLAESTVVDGKPRIDYRCGAAGEKYYLRITGDNHDVKLALVNMVQHTGTAVTVYGTSGNDRFEFAPVASWGVTVNGVQYTFEEAELATALLDGDAGDDTAVLKGTDADEEIIMAPSYALFSGSTFTVTVINTEEITAYGEGGDDVAKLYGSDGDDIFVGTPTSAELLSTGTYHNRVLGFPRVDAFDYAGGYDTAKLYDSAGDDSFYGNSLEAAIFGGDYFNRTKSFDRVDAFATAGGVDSAWLYDSAGDDIFYGTPVESALYGVGFFNRVKYFEKVYADASVGGNDVGSLYDSSDPDVLLAAGDWARLKFNGSDDFFVRAAFFATLDAYGTAGTGNTHSITPPLSFTLNLVGDWGP